MTTMANLNADSSGRKTLASQLDRLDRMLDGLGDGLTEAVAAAVKEAVGQAVERAVAGVLTEILANPGFVDRLRGTAPAPAPAQTPGSEPAGCPRPAGPFQRVQGWLRAGWRRARKAVGGGVRCATAAAFRTGAFVSNTFRRAGLVTLTVAAAVGAVAGSLAGPPVRAVVSRAAAWLAARGSQVVGWLRGGWAWGTSG